MTKKIKEDSLKIVSGGEIEIHDLGERGYMIDATGEEDFKRVKDWLWLEDLHAHEGMSIVSCEVSKANGKEFIEKCEINHVPYKYMISGKAVYIYDGWKKISNN